MDNPSPMSSPGEPAISNGSPQEGASIPPAVLRFNRAWFALHAGAVVSVAGVGFFSLSLVLPWLPSHTAYDQDPYYGWQLLFDLVYGALDSFFVSFPVYVPLGIFITLVIVVPIVGGVSVFVACIEALFHHVEIPQPKLWHFFFLIVAILLMLAPLMFGSRPDIGWWVALSGLLTVLLGSLWQRWWIFRN